MRTLTLKLTENDGKLVHNYQRCFTMQELESVDDPAYVLMQCIELLKQSLDSCIREKAIASNTDPDSSNFGRPFLVAKQPAELPADGFPSADEVEREIAIQVAADGTEEEDCFPEEKRCPLPIRNPLVPKTRRSIVGDIVREYDDTTPINFGKFNGTPLQDIDAGYFNWLWNNGLKLNKINPLHRYIKSRMGAFKMENPDLIWD